MRACRSSIESKTTARPRCRSRSLGRRGRLDDRAVRGQVAVEHGDAGVRLQRLGADPDHLAVPDLGVGQVVDQRPAGHRAARPGRAGPAPRAARRAGRRPGGSPPSGTGRPAAGRPAAARRRRCGRSRPGVSSTPSRPAMASRWTTALVEPPIAASATIALRNDPRVMTSLGRRCCGHHLHGQPAGVVRPARAAGCRPPACRPGRADHAERLGHAAPWSRRCPWCCSARGCGSSRTPRRGTAPATGCRPRTSSDSRHTSVPQPSG